MSVEATGLPHGLVQAVKAKTTIAASTDELISLNERAKESVVKMYRCTHLVLQSLICSIRAEIAPLYRVAESIALLDMLRAFACYVAEAPNPASFVRPTFTRCAVAIFDTLFVLFLPSHALIILNTCIDLGRFVFWQAATLL